MRKTKEILRLRAAGQSHRSIARSVGVAPSTVAEYLTRARAAGVGWPLPAEWTEADLEARLFPAPRPSSVARPLPEWSEVHRLSLFQEFLCGEPDVLRDSAQKQRRDISSSVERNRRRAAIQVTELLWEPR